MIVSREEAERRLKSSNNLCQPDAVASEPIHLPTEQTRHRSKEVPEFMRALAGTLGHTSKAKEVAEATGIEAATIYQYKAGIIGGKVDPDLKASVEAGLNKVQEIALEKLMLSLGLITDDKLNKCKASELSGVASDMARVIEKVRPAIQVGEGAQIIIYAPKSKTEDKYKILDV